MNSCYQNCLRLLLIIAKYVTMVSINIIYSRMMAPLVAVPIGQLVAPLTAPLCSVMALFSSFIQLCIAPLWLRYGSADGFAGSSSHRPAGGSADCSVTGSIMLRYGSFSSFISSV